ncbi:MAG: FtsL-like putative cell division protein [Owenweeksia sp.]|nr:FtsL-like putative cell division protein [Owenweeksia sp.]
MSGNTNQKSRRKLVNPLKGVFTGSFLVSKQSTKNWPFILYLSLLALIMIASSHSADRKVHEIARLRAQMKELNSEYIDTRSRLMIESMEYKVVQQAEKMGLKKSDQPPIIIKRREE